ncbi:RNA polymerase sigma factor [Marinifilum sp.]|uniref:RNA polymerase sigma factor n=1 Tax=Marinifilum sp. TaxID=2033137 RepID=UPI003BAC71A4
MTLTNNHIKQINQGDIKAFKEVYNNMFKSLCLYAYKMLQEEDVVSDAVQEAFIVMWNKRKEFNSMRGAQSYLYTVVRNNIINEIRNRKKEAKEAEIAEEIEFDNQITKEETYKLLHQAIATLPEKTQNVIKMSMNGHTNPEIAERLDVSVNTVKTLKRIGYSRLREQLKENIFLLILLSELLG